MGLKIFNNKEFPKINAGLFLFYLALLGNYSGELLPNGLITFVDNNRLVQLIVSFFMLLFTVNLYTTNVGFIDVVKYSFALWIWYIITSKQYLSTSLMILGLLLLSFVAYNLSENIDNQENKTTEQREVQKKKYRKFQNLCFIGIIIVSFVGGTKYYIDHYKQYRKANRNLPEFLFNYLFKGRGRKSAAHFID